MTPSTRRLRLVTLEDRTAPSAAYSQLPLAFEANQGQAAPGVDFLARGGGYALALSPAGAALGLRTAAGGDVLRLTLFGANRAAPAVGRVKPKVDVKKVEEADEKMGASSKADLASDR